MCRICSKTNLSLQHCQSLQSIVLELTLAWVLAEKPEWFLKRSHHTLPRSHSPLCTGELHTGIKVILGRGSRRDFLQLTPSVGMRGWEKRQGPTSVSQPSSPTLFVWPWTCAMSSTLWKIYSELRIIKPTHLAGVGEASPPQWFVAVRAQSTCHRGVGFV